MKIFVIYLVFSGFLLNNAETPHYYIWLKYLSFFKYGFEAYVVNEFKGLEFHCTESQLVPVFKVCPITTGEQVISNLEMHAGHFGQDLMILAAMYLGYLVLAYVSLYFLQKEKR